MTETAHWDWRPLYTPRIIYTDKAKFDEAGALARRFPRDFDDVVICYEAPCSTTG